jgi:Ca2+-binding RTX toxin-like protein
VGATGSTLTLSQDQVGKTITAKASYTDLDGQAESVISSATTSIADVNDAPTLVNPIADQLATEDSEFVLTIDNDVFDDIDLDILTYSATRADDTDLPDWLDFDADTRTFRGTPVNADVGSIEIKLTSSDGSASASDVFSISVSNTNDAPTLLNPIIDMRAAEEKEFSFEIPSNTFLDADVSDLLTFTATLADGSDLPAWLSFNAETKLFSGVPTEGDVGSTLNIKIVASDASESVSDTFSLTVMPKFVAATSSSPMQIIVADIYTGPVESLDYQFMGTDENEVVIASQFNDFLNLGAGNDAADGGLGHDVLDGGTGSNFLSGGEGSDTFFIDGRGGETTWSTIADFTVGEDSVNIWGWVPEVSELIQVAPTSGALGYEGVTFHYDLDNNGLIDTSITFTGLTQSDVGLPIASEVEGNGYLMFG